MLKTARLTVAGALFGAALALAAPASAQMADFTGTWSFSGQMMQGTLLLTVAPVCSLQQTGNQVAGTCKGPNAAGPATGLASGTNLSLQWMGTATDPLGRTGISVFQGTLGPDNVIRGSWTTSTMPGASGPFAAQKL